MKYLIVVGVTLLTFALSPLTVRAEPRVTSPAGTFQGVELRSPKTDQPYLAFRGIPYAQPPVGDLRFRKPQPIGNLDGVYDATDFKSFCIQLNFIESDFGIGEEDCLFLNIFTPLGASKDNLKKVYFYIHGGGNMNGFSNMYSPGSLVVSQDIIVVTLNYRLGVLGFLAAGSPSCPGNFGLWDQIEALKWVKVNIEAFGGDPEGITISGQSAGGIDASFLSISSASGQLFQQVFPMSGVTGVQTTVLDPTDLLPFLNILARREKCLTEDQPAPETEDDVSHVIQCLRQVAAENFASFEGLGGVPPLMVTVDGELIPKPAYKLFADPDYLESIGFPDRNYLVSFTYNEGAIFDVVNEDILNKLPLEQKAMTTMDMLFYATVAMFLPKSFGPVPQEVIAKVVEYYMKNHEHSPVSEFTTDAIFNIPSHEFLNATRKAIRNRNKNSYLLRFVNFPAFMGPKFKGTVHGIDLLYLFDINVDEVNKVIPLGLDSAKWGPEDDALKVKYMDLVGSFVKTGNPSSSLPSADIPSGWPAYDEESGHYLVFGNSPTVEKHFQPERALLWREWIPAWIKEFSQKEKEAESEGTVKQEL